MENDFTKLDEFLRRVREQGYPEKSWSPTTSDMPPEKISNVPLRRAENTFGNFDLGRAPEMAPAFDQCQRVAHGEAWCALLMGGPGNGKTHLAVAAMNEYGMERAYFWKVPDYLDWLKRMVFDENWALDSLTRPYREQDFLLVLDDLGVENQTDWAHEQLYQVLDARYEEELPTIITTNQVISRLDARLLSRYNAGLVVCKGKDVRRGGGSW